MNLSCLFGHSWENKTVNRLDLQSSKNYLYETEVFKCKHCEVVKFGKNEEIYQSYFESEVASIYFKTKQGEPFIITKDSRQYSIDRFTQRLQEYATRKDRTANLEKRKDYYIITVEAGPDKYIWRY